jgi:hypothetical protein
MRRKQIDDTLQVIDGILVFVQSYIRQLERKKYNLTHIPNIGKYVGNIGNIGKCLVIIRKTQEFGYQTIPNFFMSTRRELVSAGKLHCSYILIKYLVGILVRLGDILHAAPLYLTYTPLKCKYTAQITYILSIFQASQLFQSRIYHRQRNRAA